MHNVIILIGGNEGNTKDYIIKAKRFIQKSIGPIVLISSLYESEPWGFEHTQNFINQIIEVESVLTPHQILDIGQQIEKSLGRQCKTISGYEGRPMDIDILFYDRLIINTNNLVVPHPKLHERKFTLLPLLEKWGNFIHPSLCKSVSLLMNECNDDGWVKKLLK